MNGVTEDTKEYGLFYENGEPVNLRNELQILEKDKTLYCCKEDIHNNLCLVKYDVTLSYGNAPLVISSRRDELVSSVLEKCINVTATV